jgi:hypothetical protein
VVVVGGSRSLLQAPHHLLLAIERASERASDRERARDPRVTQGIGACGDDSQGEQRGGQVFKNKQPPLTPATPLTAANPLSRHPSDGSKPSDCVFITAGPSTKMCARVGEEDSGEHAL